jgi:hypothetical protein
MEIAYSDQPLKSHAHSIFLAGPSPRSKDVTSWRIEALRILDQLQYDGLVYVPERSGVATFDYLSQVEWEFECLIRAEHIAFWVPRDLEKLPGFTTNVEFGYFVSDDKAFYGRPDGAALTRYLDWFYKKITGKTPYSELPALLEHIVWEQT